MIFDPMVHHGYRFKDAKQSIPPTLVKTFLIKGLYIQGIACNFCRDKIIVVIINGFYWSFMQ